MTRARTIVLWVLTIEVSALVLTGVALFFLYEPTPAQAFGDGFADNGVQAGDVLRAVHGWASWLALPTALVAGVLLAVRARPHERVAPCVLWAVGAVALMAVGAVTGLLLPFDQIAIRTVTAGGDVAGFHRWLWNDDVLFFLIDGTEIAASTLKKWLVLHMVVVGGAVLGVVTLGWWLALRRPAPARPGPEAPSTPDTVEASPEWRP